MKFSAAFSAVTRALSISALAFVGIGGSPVSAATLPDGQYSCVAGTTSGPSPTYEIAADVVVGSSGSDCVGAVVIPTGATQIDSWAFYGATSVTSVTIPASVTSIGTAAFYGATGLTSVTLSEGVTSIGESAFQGATSLTSVTIPASVTSIGGNAFAATTSLASVSFASNSQLVSIGSSAFNNMPALTSVTIPNGVTSIGSGAFSGAISLTSVTIPASVTSIGSSAFSGATSLTSVTIPASVTSIGSSAFIDATSLVHVYFLGNAPGTVGSDAFSNIGSSPRAIVPIASTNFGVVGSLWNGLTVSYRYSATFNSTGGSSVSPVDFFSSGSISAPTAPTRVGHTFAGWSLTQGGTAVTFPYTPSSLEDVVFYAKWTSFHVCTTGQQTSDTTNVLEMLDNVALGVSGTCVGALVIPTGATQIDSWAFYGATSVTSVTIPASVTSIGTAAFYGATGLTSVTLSEGVTSIGGSAFQGATSLTSVTIPASVTSIGGNAFAATTSLASVSFASNSQLVSIGSSAFNNMPALTSVTIPNGVTSIGSGAFSGAISLTSVTIPASVTSIGSGAFSGATSLTSVTIPASVTSIGSGAFSGATSLTSVTIPASVTSIGSSAFSGATSLTSVTIPASVTSIGSSAFSGATSLVHVYFLGNAPGTVGSDAFSNIGSSPTLHILFSATGFNIINNAWNGLTVSYRYSATFNSTGGSDVSRRIFAPGDSISEPTAPTRVGHTFAGWSLTQGGTAVTFPYTPTSVGDVVFYAKWTAIPVVENQTPVNNSAPPVVEDQTPVSNSVPKTFSSKKLLDPKSLAKQVGVKIVSTRATVTVYVAMSSRKVCIATGSRLKTLKAGKCVVTFTVQEPRSKNGKLPKALKQAKSLVIK